jgi:hypothetical protein
VLREDAIVQIYLEIIKQLREREGLKTRNTDMKIYELELKLVPWSKTIVVYDSGP